MSGHSLAARKLLTAAAFVAGLGAVAGAVLQVSLKEPAPPARETAVAAPVTLPPPQVDPANTLGFPEVKGGDFSLVNQFGETRTSANRNGQHQLVFFGYAKCKAICTAALPTMAQATDILDHNGIVVTPVLITVDPERDTVAALREEAPKIHPRLVGLTGTAQALAVAYKAFNVEKKLLFEHIDEGPIYSHGSFIYLLSPDGGFQTLFPPIIGPERIAEVTAGYISGATKVN